MAEVICTASDNDVYNYNAADNEIVTSIVAEENSYNFNLLCCQEFTYVILTENMTDPFSRATVYLDDFFQTYSTIAYTFLSSINSCILLVVVNTNNSSLLLTWFCEVALKIAS